jgi:AraC-like DNA-binding protein
LQISHFTSFSDELTTNRESPLELVRAAALWGFVETVRDLGKDANALLRSVGLSRSMLADPEGMLPAAAVGDLLEAAAADTGCATIGLRMAERRSLSDLGRISLLVAHQATLRDALAVLAHYRNRINSTLVLHIEQSGDIAILREEFVLATARPMRQSADLAIGVMFGICSAILGPGWRPEQICFGYDAPAPQDAAVHARLFGCPIAFGSEMNGIVVATRDLDRRNLNFDPALALHARSLIDTVMSTHHRPIVEEVEQMILILLPAGRATITGCANALGVNQRTLQRHLDEVGTNFSRILDRVKTAQVRRYFDNRNFRLTDIAEMLGYASLGSFTRWHAETFGEPPSRTRKKLRQE